jgi:hypothetical protein
MGKVTSQIMSKDMIDSKNKANVDAGALSTRVGVVETSLAESVLQAPVSSGGDDTSALQALANTFSTSSATKLQFKRDKTYIITNVITFDLTNKKHVEIDFNGATIKLNSSFRYFNSGLFTFTFDRTKKSSIVIKNGYVDGSGNPPNFTSSAVNPNGGRGAFFVDGARIVKMDNCHFNDLFYSACLWSHYAEFGEVTNCTGVRVGGRSVDNTEDARGDALYFGYSGLQDDGNHTESSLKIDNCHFSSWSALDNPSGNSSETQKNVCQSGRAGIVFGESAITGKNKFLTISNSSFYNYQRSIHLESTDMVNVKVNNSMFLEYGSLLYLHDKSTINSFSFDNCYISKSKKVIGMEPNYDYIITGDTTNKIVNGSISGGSILGNGKLISYGNGIKLKLYHVKVEVNNLQLLTDADVTFINCDDVQFNYADVYKSGFHFINSNVTGGYKLDVNSNNFIMTTTADAMSTAKTFLIKDSVFTNVVFRYPPNTKINFENSKVIIDTNFSPVDRLGVTRNCIFPVQSSGVESINKSRFINSKGVAVNLFDSSNGMVFTDPLPINSSYFEEIQISVINTSPNFEVSISNSRFKTSGILTKFVDAFGSKAALKDSDFIGLATGEMANTTNSLKYNCYRLASGVATAI